MSNRSTLPPDLPRSTARSVARSLLRPRHPRWGADMVRRRAHAAQARARPLADPPPLTASPTRRAPAAGDWHLRADSDDDDDDIPEEYRHTKDSILWCIEATPTMLAPMLSPASSSSSSTQAGPTPSGSVRPSATQSLDWNGPPARSKMEECLRCAYAMMRRRVISSPKDLVSIMIWNCVRPLSSRYEPSNSLLTRRQMLGRRTRARARRAPKTAATSSSTCSPSRRKTFAWSRKSSRVRLLSVQIDLRPLAHYLDLPCRGARGRELPQPALQADRGRQRHWQRPHQRQRHVP